MSALVEVAPTTSCPWKPASLWVVGNGRERIREAVLESPPSQSLNKLGLRFSRLTDS